MACATSEKAGSPQVPLLELESEVLQSTGCLDLSGNCGTSPQVESARCRSSAQGAAHRQLAPGHDIMVDDGMRHGSDAGAPELARPGPESVP